MTHYDVIKSPPAVSEAMHSNAQANVVRQCNVCFDVQCQCSALLQAEARPGNGWSNLGQTLGESLETSCLPLAAGGSAVMPSCPVSVPGTSAAGPATQASRQPSVARSMDPFETLAPLYSPLSAAMTGTQQVMQTQAYAVTGPAGEPTHTC